MKIYTDNSPYGAWIGKNAIIPVIDSMEHESVGAKILSDIFGVDVDRKIRYVRVYRTLFRLGYVRVVFGRNSEDFSVEYWHKGKFSRFQKDFIEKASWKDLKHLYDWEYLELKGENNGNSY